MLSGIKVPLESLQRLYEQPQGQAERVKWEEEIESLKAAFNDARATGRYPGPSGPEYDVGLKGFQDLGEYDAIMEWENPIAAELVRPGDEKGFPRFSHS